MGGIFELHQKAIVCLIYFLELTIIPILVHAVVAWQSTAKKADSTERSTISERSLPYKI